MRFVLDLEIEFSGWTQLHLGVFEWAYNVNYEIVDNDIFTHPSWPFPVSPPREDLSLKCKVYQ